MALGFQTMAFGPIDLWHISLSVEMAFQAMARPATLARTWSFGKKQRLGRGGTEREPDALETCSTHVRRRQGRALLPVCTCKGGNKEEARVVGCLHAGILGQ